MLTGFGAGYLCPIPQLAWAKATPGGVYFTLLEHFGPTFASDLGNLPVRAVRRPAAPAAARSLAVTLEPFHIANAFSLLPGGRTPVTVADTAEIEVLVTITDTPPGLLLLERANDDVRFAWSLDWALYGHEHNLNPILDEARNSYLWASAGRAGR